MEVKRGELVTIALPGNHGKPRPALVVQDNAFSALESVTVLRVTNGLHDWPLFRITLEPSNTNGLKKRSQVMVDKPAAVPKAKIGRRIGRLDDAAMRNVDEALGRFFGLT